MAFQIKNGNPLPFGATIDNHSVNFALYSKHADKVTLCLFSYPDQSLVQEIPLNIHSNKTGNVWHVMVEGNLSNICYGWKVSQKGRFTKIHQEQEALVLDPYAKGVYSSVEWESQKTYKPLGLIIGYEKFNWEEDKPLRIPAKELIIYEMHVRGFTRHESSQVKYPGSFLGIIEKIPHLVEMGVNAVELLPLYEFNENEYRRYDPFTGKRLYNYWGYSTVNYFSPMNRYASKESYAQAVQDFKQMVKELHRHGIEIILDVVFNHTAEGNTLGPILSFKGIDVPIYYMLDTKNQFMDFTGCGNTLNVNHPIVREMILDCLQYWVTEMHVDGFRFDLATIMMRGTKGEVLSSSPLIEELSEDPILADTKLIAEPWDAGGLYQLGGFQQKGNRWAEWNDRYRDRIRSFFKGDLGIIQEAVSKLCGSQETFPSSTPLASINFITCHDGFTLHDLVSYNIKHNSANAENDHDGNPNNISWNSGVEGETNDSNIIFLRKKRMKSLHLFLMLSQGIPMIHMGDEYGHTKGGNNNTYCQDNELNWFLWNIMEKNNDFYRFYKGIIHFRKRHPILNLGRFLTSNDIDWHGKNPYQPQWEEDSLFLSFGLKDPKHNHYIYAAFNNNQGDVVAVLPHPPKGMRWYLIANAANQSPNDFFEEEDAPVLAYQRFPVKPYSGVLLKAF
jgi:isoamylase